MNPDDIPHDDTSTPDEVDDGLAFAYGEPAEEERRPQDPSPSVLDRIGEVTGSKPRVSLRDGGETDPTPMLKPLGPDDDREAGKYVVQGELGRGGVGTVHKGHDQDLGRDVAMKFLHDKYKDEAQILHRFVEEAQIGGQLQHPGIVPVYDLGMADGKPFFAMKLVKGQTLSKKLSERESPASDRRTFLSIFEDVCQTLAYAHARGVVHRDLKPANIMIGSFGEVQVVDWGMGKVLSTGGVADEKLAAERQAEVSVIETVRSGGHGSQSIVGSVMGTPAYMPPEQARGDVDAMDERSDVFALGAILCEILTGQPPYVSESNDLGEVIGMAAMAKLDDANSRLAACGAEQEMAELATRCLMPAPAARPRSAEVVAKAVHDHLAAVEARVHEARVEAAEAKVRADALKRTQRLGMGLTAVIAVGLMVSLWYWRVAKTAAENERIAHAAARASALEAQESERVAKRELMRAVEIKTLITGMLVSVTPEQAKDADTTLLAGILDTASKKLTEGAIQDERVAAELHNVTGEVYRLIGRYPDAERHLPVALELRHRLMGEEHPDTLESMNNLGLLYDDQGRYAEAEVIFLEELSIRRRALGEEHPVTLETLGNLANLYTKQGRYEEAESHYRETLELQRRVLGEEHRSTLETMGNQAILYHEQSRYAEAEPLLLEALEFMRRVLGKEHENTLSNMANLAMVYDAQGRYAEAEPLRVEVLEVRRRVLGEEHPYTLTARGNLASLYFQMGRHAEAETHFRESLELCRRVLGEEHQATLKFMGALANLYSKEGRYMEAEPLQLEALDIQRRVLGKEHPDTLGTMGDLAIIYSRQGRYADAEQLQVDVLENTRRLLGEEHVKTLRDMGNLAISYSLRGHYALAEPLFVEKLQIERRVLGEEHPQTLGTMVNLGGHHSLQGRYGEAEPLFHEALETGRRVLGEEHPDTLWYVSRLGGLYLNTSRPEKAAALFEANLATMRRVLGTQHPRTGSAIQGLAGAYLGLGRPDDALPLQRELLERNTEAADQEGADATSLNGAAWTLLTAEPESLQDPERALGYAERACALLNVEGGMQLGGALDTLALAQHRTGNTAAAVETQRRAISLMPEGADPSMASRLAEYEAALKDN